MGVGLLLTVVAGTMGGSFPLPMRYMKKWAWENVWTVWSVVALILMPWLLALTTVSHLASVYADAGVDALLLAALFGLLWGISQFLFGLSVDLVGMSLTFAVVNGLSAAIGSLVPLLVQHPGQILSSGGIIVSLGVLGTVGGVATCSWAGHLRSEGLGRQNARPAGSKSAFWRGLVVTIMSGVMAPCLNLGFAFGRKISAAAINAGSSSVTSTNAVLAVVLTAGFLSNFGYCYYRLSKNRTAGLFRIHETGRYILLGSIMALLWTGNFSLYGSATSFLGEYGAVVGWPTLMAVVTIVSSLWDVRYGEWSRRPLRVMALGVGMLVVAVAVIADGSYNLRR